MGRRITVGALGVGAGLATVAIMLAFAVAQGEARGHALFHLIFAVPLAGLLAILGLAWRPAASTAASTWQTVVVVLVAVAFVGATLEAIGGTGYDRFDAAEQREPLTTIHDLALYLGAALLLAVPLGLGTLFALAVQRLVRRGWTLGATAGE